MVVDFRFRNDFTITPDLVEIVLINQIMRGPMAHILHAGGPWKLESPCRSQETGVNMAARQANKVPGGQWGPRVVGLSHPDGLGS